MFLNGSWFVLQKSEITAMKKFLVVTATAVAILVVVQQSFALKCFVCNSFHQADCSDWFDNVTQHLVACEDWQPKCRKVVQEVWLEDHWDVRYIRQCAAGGDIGAFQGKICDEIYGTYNIRVRHCHCDNQDGCNGAQQQTAMISLTLPVLLTLVVTFHRHLR